MRLQFEYFVFNQQSDVPAFDLLINCFTGLTLKSTLSSFIPKTLIKFAVHSQLRFYIKETEKHKQTINK